MSTFSDALRKASALTLEMKSYEMKSHIEAMNRMYQKYLKAEGEGMYLLAKSAAAKNNHCI